MRNKANVAILLLPVVTIGLCIFAIMSFIALDDKFSDISHNISEMSSDLNVMQDYVEASAAIIIEDFIKNGFTPDTLRESAEKRDLHLEGQGNLFVQIQNGEFKIGRDGNKVLVEIPGVFVQARKGESLWKREWDLKAEANINGEFIRFINK